LYACRGLRARGPVAASGGRRQEREALVATIAKESHRLERPETLELYIRLEALMTVCKVLAGDEFGAGDSPFETLLLEGRRDLFGIGLDDGINVLGFDQFNELWPNDESEWTKREAREHKQAKRETRLIAARLLMVASRSGDYLKALAARMFEQYHDEVENV
jgi:hypothetical protein